MNTGIYRSYRLLDFHIPIGRLQVIVAASFFLCCQPVSQPATNLPDAGVQARYHLGLPPSQITTLPTDTNGLISSLNNQRTYAIQQWQNWLSPLNSTIAISRFLSLYDRSDIRRMFLYLWQQLSPEQRQGFSGFTQEQILAAEAWNASYASTLPGWTSERLQQWLEQRRQRDALGSLGGFSRILYDRELTHSLMEQSHLWLRCQPPQRCFTAPIGATAFKISLKRVGGTYQVPTYYQNPRQLLSQLSSGAGETWQPTGQLDFHATASLPAIHNSQGSRFIITGLHMAIKTHDEWFWSSLALSGAAPSGLGLDTTSLAAGFNGYKMCTVAGFEWPDLDSQWPAINQLLQDTQNLLIDPNTPWCSNPYLELGTSNHLSQCLGCHQHAGRNLNNQQIAALLEDHPTRLLHEQWPAAEVNGDYLFSVADGLQSLRAELAPLLP